MPYFKLVSHLNQKAESITGIFLIIQKQYNSTFIKNTKLLYLGLAYENRVPTF